MAGRVLEGFDRGRGQCVDASTRFTFPEISRGRLAHFARAASQSKSREFRQLFMNARPMKSCPTAPFASAKNSITLARINTIFALAVDLIVIRYIKGNI